MTLDSFAVTIPMKMEFTIICVSAFLITLVLLTYYFYFRNKISLAFQILMLLFFNQLGVIAAEFLPFFKASNSALCSINLTLRTGFNIAANFWTCFIARMVYKQLKQPGKFIVLWRYIIKNIIYTYLPSICVVGLIILIILTDTNKQYLYTCSTNAINHTLRDYIVYIIAFLLPSLLTLVISSYYVIMYLLSEYQKFNKFLLFPIAQSILSLYYLIAKIYLLVGKNFDYSDVFYFCEPIIYSIIYAMLVCLNFWNKKQDDSQSLSSSMIKQNNVFQ